MLDRAAIFALKPKPSKINTPAGEFLIRPMNGAERESFEQAHVKEGMNNIRARMFVATVCDKNGNLLFTAADLDAVNDIDCQILDAVFRSTMKLNGFDKDEIEDAAKN